MAESAMNLCYKYGYLSFVFTTHIKKLSMHL